MQICRKSIFFVFRVVPESYFSFIIPNKPSVLLAKVTTCSFIPTKSRVLNIFYNFWTMGKTKYAFYAVAHGRSPGIYSTWDDCKLQVDSFPNARYKKFGSEDDAKEFIKQHGSLPQANSQSSSNKLQPPSNIATTTVKVQSSLKLHPPMSTSSASLAKSQKRLRTIALTQKESIEALTRSATNSLQSQPKREFSTSPVVKKRKVSGEGVITKELKSSTLSNNNVANLNDFMVDETGYIVVYTDGACTNNGNLGAKAGVGVWFGDNHALNLSEPVSGRQTNNTAEIQAAEKAIAIAKQNGIVKLNVKTDSQFVIKCITTWIHKWKTNQWKVRGGKPVVNRSDLEKLDATMDNMDIKWSYVPGHQGHHGNECADRLAVEGANKQ